jgi:glycerophosphoryl diester phosphodiesterase
MAPAEHRVIKVAHRGGAGLAPENTLAAFRAGLEYGADALELDVHLSRDGELVVIHDPIVARTTNAAGEVGALTFAELRLLDASARYFGPPVGRQLIPTLQEVVELAKGRASLQIEIKVRADGSRYPGIEAKVVETLRRSGMVDEAVVLSFDFPTLAAVKQIEPRLRTCALISRAYLEKIGKRGPAAVAAEMTALGATFVGVEKSWLSEPLYKELRARGLGVGAWTVDDPEAMRKFALMGVDFITSNRPDLLREALATPKP